MITNKQYKEDMLLVLRMFEELSTLDFIGNRHFNKLFNRVNDIPDEEPVPKTGFDPNEHLAPKRCGELHATYPADPDHDEYYSPESGRPTKGDPDIEHD